MSYNRSSNTSRDESYSSRRGSNRTIGRESYSSSLTSSTSSTSSSVRRSSQLDSTDVSSSRRYSSRTLGDTEDRYTSSRLTSSSAIGTSADVDLTDRYSASTRRRDRSLLDRDEDEPLVTRRRSQRTSFDMSNDLDDTTTASRYSSRVADSTEEKSYTKYSASSVSGSKEDISSPQKRYSRVEQIEEKYGLKDRKRDSALMMDDTEVDTTTTVSSPRKKYSIEVESETSTSSRSRATKGAASALERARSYLGESMDKDDGDPLPPTLRQRLNSRDLNLGGDASSDGTSSTTLTQEVVPPSSQDEPGLDQGSQPQSHPIISTSTSSSSQQQEQGIVTVSDSTKHKPHEQLDVKSSSLEAKSSVEQCASQSELKIENENEIERDSKMLHERKREEEREMGGSIHETEERGKDEGEVEIDGPECVVEPDPQPEDVNGSSSGSPSSLLRSLSILPPSRPPSPVSSPSSPVVSDPERFTFHLPVKQRKDLELLHEQHDVEQEGKEWEREIQGGERGVNSGGNTEGEDGDDEDMNEMSGDDSNGGVGDATARVDEQRDGENQSNSDTHSQHLNPLESSSPQLKDPVGTLEVDPSDPTETSPSSPPPVAAINTTEPSTPVSTTSGVEPSDSSKYVVEDPPEEESSPSSPQVKGSGAPPVGVKLTDQQNQLHRTLIREISERSSTMADSGENLDQRDRTESLESTALSDRVKSPLSPFMERIKAGDFGHKTPTNDDPDNPDRTRTPSFHWFKDGEEFDAGDRFACEFDDGEDTLALVFQRVTPEDAGLYTCIAKTTNGKISCSAELTVQGDVRQLRKTPEPPEVKATVADVEATQGSSAMIEAKISGYPQPEITWLHDNEPVEADARHKFLMEDEESYCLVIKNVQPEDAGTYAIKAHNELGDAETGGKLQVNSPPKIKKELGPKTGILGETIRIEVECSGCPFPTIRWTKDGKDITPTSSPRVKMIADPEGGKHVLVIEKCDKSDEGAYNCTIINSLGQQSSGCAVAVKSLPVFVQGLKDMDMKKGDRVEFSVKVSGSPIPDIHFLKDGKEMVPSARVKLIKPNPKEGEGPDGTRNYSLVIEGVEPEDVGKYTVSARNECGCSESTANLGIRSPPSFSRTLSDIESREGDQNVSFTVKISASPSPTVEWFINGKVVHATDHLYNITNDGAEFTLLIPEVKEGMAGDYSVKATNAEGTADSKCKFTVTSKPKVTQGLKDINLDKLDGDVTLKIIASGSPTPEVTFMKDGKKVEESDRIKLIKDEATGSYSLKIKGIKESDLGSYEAIVKNNLGEVKSKCKVSGDVTKPPVLKKTLNDVHALHDQKNIKLSIEVEDMTGCTITWYVDDIPIVKEDVRYNISEKGDTIIIKNADEGTAGVYRAVVSNDKGSAESKAEVTVSSHPEFMQGLEDRESLEGESISMDVVISGNPPPTITWFRDGKEITTGGNITIEKESDLVYILTIEKVSSSNTGLYECVIKNRVGECKSRGNLVLLTPPFFLKNLEDTTGVIGENGCLEVIVGGSPQPSVTWFKATKALPTSILSENPDGKYRLRFEPVEVDDQAEYYVEAKNKVGKVTSPKVHFKPIKADKKATFKQGMAEDKVAERGDQLVLTCVLDDGKDFELDDIIWTKDGNKIVYDDRVSVTYDPTTGTSTLTIDNVTEDDLGQYQCSCNGAKTSCKVKAGNSFIPKFKKELEDINALDGQENITLTVQMTSTISKSTRIRWFIDSVEISSNDSRFEWKQTDDSFTLLIKRAEDNKTTGQFKCVVSNSVASCESTCKVTVSSAAKFVEQLKDKEMELGFDINLRVRVSGAPIPTIKWFKDGHELVIDGSRIRQTYDSNTSSHTLCVSSVSESDLGSYSCEAVNSVGKDTTSCIMTPGSSFLKPSFIKGLSDLIVDVDQDNVILSVTTGSCRSKLAINWYLNDVEITERDEGYSFKHEEGSHLYQLIITKATKSTIGTYKCMASNEHGKVRTNGKLSHKRSYDFEVHLPERKPIEREPFNFTSESHYTPGPETMLLQHRDPDYPLRVREYLRVGAMASPSLRNKLRESHWGDADVSINISHQIPTFYFRSHEYGLYRVAQIGYGFSPQVAVRERRRFGDIQKEIEKEVINNEPYTRGRRYYKKTYVPISRPTTPIQ